MKILKLNAENVKKLVAIEIAPHGDIVKITGKNGAGKSSVLDAIWWALAGASHIQAQPIRKGQEKARIRLDLGDLVVERKFSEKGSTLTVENMSGARFPSPQKMLDELLGELSFDPLAFSRMDPRKQFDELRRVSEIDVDIDALDALNKSDYAKRTDINRDAKARRAQAEGVRMPEGKPAELIDESTLVDDLQKAGEINADIETRKENRKNAQAMADEKKKQGVDARYRASDLREQANKEDDRASKLLEEAAAIEKKIDAAQPLPSSVDVAALRAKIDEARQANARATIHRQAVKNRDAYIGEAERLEDKSAELTANIEARNKAKDKAIANAKMPVDGIGFGDGVVTYNGIPLDQASSAEQLRVSLSIAMAANPKLRVIRIQDGSLLDDDSLAAISEAAAVNDYQVWIEMVDTSGKVGIVIEDGMVKDQNEGAALNERTA